MDENRPNVIDCETSTKKNKQKFVWDYPAFKVYIDDACLVELNNGNRPGSHFNKIGWANIGKTMLEKTGKNLNEKQIKNKLDLMKKEWKLYDRLMRLETGIGGTRSYIDASPEWWDEKIKANKDYAKFKDANLEIFDTHYALLFRDSVAVGDNTMTPLQFQDDSNPRREENIEGNGDTDEISLDDDETLFPKFVGSSSSKREKSKNLANKRARQSQASSFEDKLDVVSEALSTNSTQTFPPNNRSLTLADCMNIVITFPGYEEGSKEYTQAVLVFVKTAHREAFMYPTTNEAKMAVLKSLVKE